LTYMKIRAVPTAATRIEAISRSVLRPIPVPIVVVDQPGRAGRGDRLRFVSICYQCGGKSDRDAFWRI
jgi:hypothetical protein